MGFFKKKTTSMKATMTYPAKRNRINQQQQTQQMQTSSYAYNNNYPHTTTSAPVVTSTSTQPLQQPVVATAYVPTSSAPVVATAFVPSSTNATTTPSATAAPVLASAYIPTNDLDDGHTRPSAPPMNPSYDPNYTSSVVAGNNYNTKQDEFWECSVCTFPNLLSETHCKGCGNANPGGKNSSYSKPQASSAVQSSATSSYSTMNHINSHMASISLGTGTYPNGINIMSTSAPPPSTSSSISGTMKVHIPPGMHPGQKLKVRSPTGDEVVKSIPSQSEWSYEVDGRPFFRLQFGSSQTVSSSYSTSAPTMSTASTMKVHIPSGMGPGQRIKVRSPTGSEVIKTIPNQSEWSYETDGRPFFRMTFDAQSNATSNSYSTTSSATMSYRPPPHSTTWREFHTRASSRYNPPPIGMTSVNYVPRGLSSITPNGRHKSLLIGINYTGTRAALRGCINDAKNMQTLLLRNGFPNDGSHMLMLTDERHRGSEYQPTASNIMKAMAWLMNDVQKGDVLFFHFSGHGGQVPDKTGHEADGWNETLIPLDHTRAGQISDDVLWGSLVYNLPEGARLTALMDMCHSGTGLDLPYDYNVNTRRWTEDVNPAHSKGDAVLFSGCEDSQTSADVQGYSGAGGAMTLAFTKAYQQCPSATYHEFLSVVKRELRKKRHSQRPQLTSSQQFDANSRIFSLGHESEGGRGITSMIEPNHNPQVGRQKRRHVRPARQGFGGGGGNDLFGLGVAAVGAALFADAFF
eukprot:scaffold2612_cov132-Skeletonema_menzelii.AAC.3